MKVRSIAAASAAAAALIARLGTAISTVSFDLRSHGRSWRSSPENATIDQLGADLRAVLADRVAGVGLIWTSTGKFAYPTLGIPAGLARISDPAMRLASRGLRRQTNLFERGRARVADAAWLFTKRLLPKATLVLIREAGHQVLMDRAELVSAPPLRLVEDAVERG